MQCKRWVSSCLLAGALATASLASAQTLPRGIEGVARTGTDQRPAVLKLSCSQNGRNSTGALSVELWLPNHSPLERTFDFDSIEGPYPQANAPATLVVNGVAAPPVGVAAWNSPDGPDTYVFATAAMMRGDAANLRRMVSALRPLMEAPGTLVWRQSNARSGGPPIEASFTLADADAVRLRPLMAPCLGPVPPAASATPVASVWRNGGRGFGTTVDIRALGEGRFMVKIDGHAGDCMLGVDGVATETAPGRMTLLTGSGGEQCRLGLERRGDSQLVIAEESDGCSAYHGARCNFLGTLTRTRR